MQSSLYQSYKTTQVHEVPGTANLIKIDFNENQEQLINIQNIEGSLLVSSREVSVNFEKEHSKILRTIKEKIEVNPILASPKYFIESTYLDKSNRQSKEYLMTRDGFTFLVMGFNGAKADNWKLKYIEAFNHMEEAIKNPYANMSKELQAIFAIDKKQQQLESKVSYIEDKMTVNYELAENLRSLINARAVELLGGKHTKAYKVLNKKLFAAFYKDIKRVFKVNSYKNISIKNYEDAIRYIEGWEPGALLSFAIQGVNSQIEFEVSN